MVCQGYKAPEYIDPKFLDPKYAFEDIDGAKGGLDGNSIEQTTKVSSLKKLLATKRANRGGYADDKVALLYEKTDLIDFLESADPFEFLSKFHAVSSAPCLIDPFSLTSTNKQRICLKSVKSNAPLNFPRFSKILKFRAALTCPNF
jgi:hypothetical protein